MVISTGLKILYAFWYRKYIKLIHLFNLKESIGGEYGRNIILPCMKMEK
jgi:hypothetical protein